MVIHDAERTGPPVFALDLLEWLATNAAVRPTAVLVAGGPLVEDFRALGPTIVLDDAPEEATAALRSASIVYLNTAASVEALRRTGVRPERVLSHVHERDVALRHYLPAEDHDLLLAVTGRYLVGPECARRNLVENHGVDADRIATVPYFVPRGHDRSDATAPPPREVLGIGPATTVVGGAGTRDWRKGPDLFAQSAWEVRRRRPDADVRFVWVGGPIPSVDHWDPTVDVPLLGLEGRIDFLDHQPDPKRWMAAFDLFALTSREDTFPLVCLEAGALGVPIVCFDTSGIPELVRAAGGGAVVDYPDVPALAAALVERIDDSDLRRGEGEALRRHIEAHHRLEDCGAAVAAEIARMVP